MGGEGEKSDGMRRREKGEEKERRVIRDRKSGEGLRGPLLF